MSGSGGCHGGSSTFSVCLFPFLLWALLPDFLFCTIPVFPATLPNIALVYILALVLVARYTVGYAYGIVCSLFAVICVNYFFTYPYFELNFTLTGYPITFLGMLAITLLTSTTTSHLIRQASMIAEREKLLAEAEKEKMRANLLRAISHDLRTPLTGIIGNSSVYLENQNTLSEKEKTELISNIYNDSNWLLNMVENLLTVTRIKGDNLSIAVSEEGVGGCGCRSPSQIKEALSGHSHQGYHTGGLHPPSHGSHPHRAGHHQSAGKCHCPCRKHKTY